MAIYTNIAHKVLTRGDTFVHRITVKNTDETPRDITGATVRYTVRSPNYEGEQILQKTVGNGIQLTNPTVGVLDVTLSSINTASLSPVKKYVYDCEVTLAGTVLTVLTGKLFIVADASY